MGNTLGHRFGHTATAEFDETSNPEDNNEGATIAGTEAEDENQEENLEKFITTDTELQQRRKRLQIPVQPQQKPKQKHQRRLSGAGRWAPEESSAVEINHFQASIFDSVVEAVKTEKESKVKHQLHNRPEHEHEREQVQKWCIPFIWTFYGIWNGLLYLNRLAANPVGSNENIFNGCIFAAVLGILQHMLLAMFPLTNDPLLSQMYCCPGGLNQKVEFTMFICNALVLVSVYSVIWQTCGPFLFISPTYMVYIIICIMARHSGSRTVFSDAHEAKSYAAARTIEQILRLFILVWEFCVVMAYTRQVQADRTAHNAFIRARKRRLDFISRTRRHEDRKQFMRDPIRQRTVLLLADPKRPWVKQTVAARLAALAFAENETIASLWGSEPVAEKKPKGHIVDSSGEESEVESGAHVEEVQKQDDVKGKSILAAVSAKPGPEVKKKWFGGLF